MSEDRNQEIALERILKASHERWTVLHLNSLGLVRVPPEISQLSNLTFLDLRDNKLDELPDEICDLRNLESIHLSLWFCQKELFSLKNYLQLAL
jgi:Leucine-rich repeat (LRR) protein